MRTIAAASTLRQRYGLCLLLGVAILAAACGKKGPPLPPLRLVPAPMTLVTVRLVGGNVQVHFKLPTANANGPGRVNLDHVEVFAVTVAPGSLTPPDKEFLTKTYAAGTIAVKPPPTGDAAPTEGTPVDTRPGPGDEVTFTEELTDARKTPASLPKAPPVRYPAIAPVPPLPTPGTTAAGQAAAAPGATAPAGTAAAPAAPPGTTAPATTAPATTAPATTPPAATPPAAPAAAGAAAAPAAAGQATTPTGRGRGGQGDQRPAMAPPAAAPVLTTVVRVYTLRGVTPGGRFGPASSRVLVPIVPPPPPPIGAKASFTEKNVVVTWTAPSMPAPARSVPAPAPSVPGTAPSAPAATPAPPVPAPTTTPPTRTAAPTATTPAATPTPPPTTPAPPAAPAPLTFNVYRTHAAADTAAAAAVPAKPGATPAPVVKPDAPLNPAPLTATTLELPTGELGKAQCFVVRSAVVEQSVTLESDASPETCVTPSDIFPPAAPQGLSLLLLDGALELVWDAGTEPDIAGYTVLRGDAPGDTLRPLTPSPIHETTFRDTTVRSGAHYVYAVVAVDRAGNVSPRSATVEGNAR